MRTSMLNVLLCISPPIVQAQQKDIAIETLTQARITALVQEVSETQSRYLASGGAGVSYKAHWVNHEEDETAEVIGSTEGRIERILSQNGQPISSANDSKEKRRLEDLLRPGKLRDANNGAAHFLPYFLQLTRAMPQAMVYSPAPRQPQRLNPSRRQIVLDYSPNPAFHPRSLAESTLGKLSGRLWIDALNHNLLRMEIHIDQDVNVVGGVLAKVYRGGTVEYEQQPVVEGQYTWTHIHLHLRLRELLLKGVPVDTDLTATEIQLLAPAPSGVDAVHSLLSMRVTTR